MVSEGSANSAESPDSKQKDRPLIANDKMKTKTKTKKKKRGGRSKRMPTEQALAILAVKEWAVMDRPGPNPLLPLADGFINEFAIRGHPVRSKAKIVFELHSHSKCSDGFLSPSKLVQRAHSKGVDVLALTDHDTMAGIPEAMDVARRLGIKIIPGVEISTIFSPSGVDEAEEAVHILAYYGSCGPSRAKELERFLGNIRDGRFLRAKDMIMKLLRLNLPIKWEDVVRIAGQGVAPGRVHVARAMVQAGHVDNLKQAFSKYLYNDGPAYSKGRESAAEEAVQMICETGGIAVLAHPWVLKKPAGIITRLRAAGLHGIEAYRSDGKVEAFSSIADDCGLLKLGGSDYHGKGEPDEPELGSVDLPITVLRRFLAVADPIWRSSARDVPKLEPISLELSQVSLSQ